MSGFSEFSKANLATCHPDLQVLFNEVIKDFDCRIQCGHRDKAGQDAAYPKYSQVQWPNSMHNKMPSLAVDVLPYPVDWKNEKSFYFFAGRVLATAERLLREKKMMFAVRWGGDWDRDNDLNDHKFIDLPHYELVIPSVQSA